MPEKERASVADKKQGNQIKKVEAVPGGRWARVTVTNKDGRARTINVRRGSVFPNRPKPAP